MPELYTPEWAAEVAATTADLPDAPGIDGVVSIGFLVAPRKEVALHWRYDAGVATAGEAGPATEPALALTLAKADAVEVMTGAVEPSVAFMRGRLKAAGDGAVLLAFLKSTTADSFGGWLEKVATIAPFSA